MVKEDSIELGKNFTFIKEVEIAAQIIFDISTSPGKDKINSGLSSSHLNIFSSDPLYETLRKTLIKNAEIINKYLNG